MTLVLVHYVIEEPNSFIDSQRSLERSKVGKSCASLEPERIINCLIEAFHKIGSLPQDREADEKQICEVFTRLPSCYIPGRVTQCSAKIQGKLWSSLAYMTYVDTCKVTRS